MGLGLWVNIDSKRLEGFESGDPERFTPKDCGAGPLFDCLDGRDPQAAEVVAWEVEVRGVWQVF